MGIDDVPQQDEKKEPAKGVNIFDLPVNDRFRLALDKDTTAETLAVLSKDPEKDTRYAVAAHKNTKPETLVALSEDDDDIVERAAKANSNFPKNENK